MNKPKPIVTSFNFQTIKDGDLRPTDHGCLINVISHSNLPITMPSVNDLICVRNTEQDRLIEGRVKSRFFRYVETFDEYICEVFIVISLDVSENDHMRAIKE